MASRCKYHCKKLQSDSKFMQVVENYMQVKGIALFSTTLLFWHYEVFNNFDIHLQVLENFLALYQDLVAWVETFE